MTKPTEPVLSISCRVADRADIAAMSRLRAAEWGTEEYWVNRIAGYLDGTHNPQKALPPRILYIAQQGDCLIGFIAGHLSERFDCNGELEWINIAPDHRGTGAATKLLHLLAAWFVDQNATRICVNCDTGNTAAFRFYTRRGAKPMNPHWLIWEDISMALSKGAK